MFKYLKYPLLIRAGIFFLALSSFLPERYLTSCDMVNSTGKQQNLPMKPNHAAVSNTEGQMSLESAYKGKWKEQQEMGLQSWDSVGPLCVLPFGHMLI
jgi:hypothetical protein